MCLRNHIRQVTRVSAIPIVTALLCVPSAGADGISWSVTSGVKGDNGWYRSPVVVHVTATATGCPSMPFDITFNTSADSFSCGSGATKLSLQFNIDPDPPVVTGATTDRGPDKNGWYTHPVTIAFSGSDANSGLASCSSTSFSGPDSATATATGTCRDNAGNVSAPGSFQLKYDSTPPTVTATPSRPPDSDGWYNHPFSVSFAGTDGLSGIDTCTGPQSYSGPNQPAGQLSGSCVDQAGNTATVNFPFRYDSTPPTVSGVAATVGNRSATLTWRQSPDTTSVTVSRAPGRNGAKTTKVYHGKARKFRDTGLRMGVKYHYTVTTTDDAGNVAQAGTSAAIRALYAPVPGRRVKAGATLAWVPAKSASYYNIQIFRGRKKVLSTWPGNPRFRLPRSWAFEHHRYTLKRGKYKWYVWPGLGPRSKAHYGKLLGGSTFTVR